jgi:hypothetical protein
LATLRLLTGAHVVERCSDSAPHLPVRLVSELYPILVAGMAKLSADM